MRYVFVLTMLFTIYSMQYAGAETNSKNFEVRNGQGKLIGKIYSSGEVRDAAGKLLGRTKNGNTYDAVGRKLLDKELPGYLLK